MKVPFLVKQYISNDLEKGSFSRVYWYYPLEGKENRKGGVGIFFEILAGDLDPEVYEQVSKYFWNTFRDTYYDHDFETALKRSSAIFLQILRQVGVEEGLDINMSLFSVSNDKKIVLKLAQFGETDIFLIRDNEYADVTNLAPTNQNFYDLKYMELDLLSGDVLIFGNRSLISNSIETGAINIEKLSKLFESLEDFKENLYGNRKIFCLATVESETKVQNNLKKVQIFQRMIKFRTKLAESVVKAKLLYMKLFRKLFSVFGRKQNKGDEHGVNACKAKKNSTDQNGDEQLKKSVLANEIYKATDPVAELRRRRSLVGRLANSSILKNFLEFLGSKLKNSNIGGLKSRNLSLNYKTGRGRGVTIILVAIIVLLLMSWLRKNIVQSRLERAIYKEVQNRRTKFEKLYKSDCKNIELEDPEHRLELCIAEAETFTSYISDSRSKVKSNRVQKQIKAEQEEFIKSYELLMSQYDTIYNIKRIKDATLITDLGITLGSDSNIIDMDIQKGTLVLADGGRKAVYQVNLVTGTTSKLDDTDNLITELTSVAGGSKNTFACDKVNGILYYSSALKFERLIGTDPGSLGHKCGFVKAYNNNVYMVPETKDSVIRVLYEKGAFSLPGNYISGLSNVTDLMIDGNIYVIEQKEDGYSEVKRFFGGRYDNSFRIPDELVMENVVAGYTNPSDSFPLYIYDRKSNEVKVIEKPTSTRHPGKGKLIKTYKFENRTKFDNIKDISVDLSSANNKEVNMYILNGNTIWKVKL